VIIHLVAEARESVSVQVKIVSKAEEKEGNLNKLYKDSEGKVIPQVTAGTQTWGLKNSRYIYHEKIQKAH
jgi:hypothetical protein